MNDTGYALIFDCDGVLADTERYGHLAAFNSAFQELGIPMRWSEQDYAALVRIGGGKERIAAAFADPRFRGTLSTDALDPGSIPAIHNVKTRLYRALVADGVMPPRPGVARLMRSALADGWQVAVASTSAPESVRSVLDTVVGSDTADKIPIFAGDVVREKKPAPDIYLLALENLRANAPHTVVVEDSEVGLRAADSAGLACIVTPSSFTVDEDFTLASAVVSSLGDDGEPAIVLADPHGIGFRDVVDIDTLRKLLTRKPHTPTRTQPEYQ